MPVRPIRRQRFVTAPVSPFANTASVCAARQHPGVLLLPQPPVQHAPLLPNHFIPPRLVYIPSHLNGPPPELPASPPRPGLLTAPTPHLTQQHLLISEPGEQSCYFFNPIALRPSP